jgi:two-component system, cell cycle sensor histidine kinase and response regulator CckA
MSAAGQPRIPETGIANGEKTGNAGFLLLLAGLLVGAAVALGFIANEWAQVLILALLALLSIVGVFSLFALAIGMISFGGRRARRDVTSTIIDAADEAILVTEDEGRITYANAAYLRLANAATANAAKPVERLFIGAADVSEAIYRLSNAGREGRRLAEDVRLSARLSGEAEPVWYNIRVSPLARTGAAPSTLWHIAEVTDQRRGQETIFQELQHAIDFLDHAPCGFMSIDQSGDVPYINATLAGWLGYDLARVGSGGLSLSQIASGNADALIRAIRGEAGDVRTEVLDVDLRKRNGQLLPVRLHHEVGFGQDGLAGPSRTLVLNRSADGAGADAGSAAEVRLARFFQHAPMAIATLAGDGRIIRSNASFARLSPAKSLSEFLSEPEALQGALAAAMTGASEIAPVDVNLAGATGRSARIYLSPAQDAGDEGERVTLYALDTTDERKLKDNIDQAQKMQAVGQLAGGIAHDFNNVLQVIINASEFLLASHKPTDPSFPDIMQIKQNAYRAASLVRQLLAFSRRQTLRPQLLEMVDVLSDVQLMLKRAVGDKVTLDVRHGRDLWPVKADLGQLEQVIVNLCVNARDAMPGGGKVTVRTSNIMAIEAAALKHTGFVAADYVLLEVEDTGTGISAENIDKIFEPFFTTKEVGKGTGLGLSMVYGIVKQTGGYVFCDSTVGKGTNFKIYLPRHVPTLEEKAAELEAKAPVKKTADNHTGQGIILLVEDEDAVRALNGRMLTSRGYTVLEANSGLEALRIFNEEGGKIDLVVSDVVMPEMDGPTMLGELRKLNAATRVVFVSGYAEEAFRKNLPDGEEFHFLPKPFTMKQLVEAVKAAMG